MSEAIPKGYKQTEIGVIPADWEMDFLENLADVIDPHPSHRAPSEKRLGIPFVGIGDLSEDGRIKSEKCRLVGLEVYKEHRKRYNLEDDLIGLGRVASIGKVVKLKNTIEKYVISPTLGLIAPKDLNKELLYYLLNCKLTKSQFLKIMSGSTRSSVGMIVLRKLKIAYPKDPKEQSAIATALSETDELIQKLDKLLTKKKDIKKGAMQELLTGKKRLPGFNGEWEKSKLIEITSMPVTDGPHSTPKFLKSGVPFLSVNNIVNYKIDWSDLRYISKEDDIEFSRKCKPKKGDILLGKAATVGTVAIVDSDCDFNIWSPLALIRINSKHEVKFFYYYFQTPTIITQIKLFTNSSSQGNIGMRDIEKLEFPVPKSDEQSAIASVLSDMDSEIKELEQKRDKYRMIKEGMMQQLLTGRIRLKWK